MSDSQRSSLRYLSNEKYISNFKKVLLFFIFMEKLEFKIINFQRGRQEYLM